MLEYISIVDTRVSITTKFSADEMKAATHMAAVCKRNGLTVRLQQCCRAMPFGVVERIGYVGVLNGSES